MRTASVSCFPCCPLHLGEYSLCAVASKVPTVANHPTTGTQDSEGRAIQAQRSPWGQSVAKRAWNARDRSEQRLAVRAGQCAPCRPPNSRRQRHPSNDKTDCFPIVDPRPAVSDGVATASTPERRPTPTRTTATRGEPSAPPLGALNAGDDGPVITGKCREEPSAAQPPPLPDYDEGRRLAELCADDDGADFWTPETKKTVLE